MRTLFDDRRQAGKRLAERLTEYAGQAGVVVLGLPRGGVPVAYEVAHSLGAPLDVLVVRKLGVPGHEEYAMGAIASGGVCVLDEAVIRSLGLSAADVADVRAAEETELARRERAFRGGQPPLDVHGSTVLLIDDGLATGSTMQAAVAALRVQHPAAIVVAVPVASYEAAVALTAVADHCVCLAMPEPFFGVGMWYGSFPQTSDEEVHDLLGSAALRLPEDARTSALASRRTSGPTSRERSQP